MTCITTTQLPHLPDHPVHVGFFKDVQNATFLRQQLLAGNTDYEYAFLDGTAIVSTAQVFAAVFRAINDMLHDRLKSRNVHSEIVYSLSPNNNIAESFRRFGISDTTTALLAIKVSQKSSPSSTDVEQHLSSSVEGHALEFSDENIRSFTDLSKVRKIYKLDSGNSKPTKGGKGKKEINGVGKDESEEKDERKEMEAVILGIMTLKGN